MSHYNEETDTYQYYTQGSWADVVARYDKYCKHDLDELEAKLLPDEMKSGVFYMYDSLEDLVEYNLYDGLFSDIFTFTNPSMPALDLREYISDRDLGWWMLMHDERLTRLPNDTIIERMSI